MIGNWADILDVIISSQASSGEEVNITIPVKNVQSYAFRIGVSVAVDGGWAWLTPTLTSPGATTIFSASFIMPNYNVMVTITTYMVILEELFPGWYEDSWYPDDVETFSVTLPGAEVGVETLEVDITPVGTGYVTTVPASDEGRSTWHNGDTGTFPYGTQVKVTAHPLNGYRFEKWSDEILGGVSYENPSYVQPMVEHRAVKCHFREDIPTFETLEIDITPAEGGHVETVPASEEGKTEWHNGDTGTFAYGTKVQVTAHPATGYYFDHWSDEIVGGTSVANPSYVQDMTEHRAVKCHFRTEEEKLETLEVDITPVGKGYVTTVPASEEGKTEWHNNETGTFPYGTKVQVTAHPEEGYVFEKWSDEIVGGVSHNNPEYVQDMTEHRAVKAHFITEEEAEEPETGFVEGDGVIEEVIILHGLSGLFEITGEEKVPPVTGVKTDDWFKLMVTCSNKTERAMRMKLVFTITKPDASVITDTVEEAWPYTGGGKEHRFVEPTYGEYWVDVVGDWNLSMELMAGDVVLDTWEGLILSGVEKGPPGILDTLSMILPLLVMGLMVGMISPMMKEGF